jgi:hypothetical protein
MTKQITLLGGSRDGENVTVFLGSQNYVAEADEVLLDYDHYDVEGLFGYFSHKERKIASSHGECLALFA